MSSSRSVPETKLEHGEAGVVPAGEGWFVVNAREARWIERPRRGHSLPLTGWTEEEAETYFPQLGLNLVVLGPGEPIGDVPLGGRPGGLRQSRIFAVLFYLQPPLSPVPGARRCQARSGFGPEPPLTLVAEWARLHRAELEANWERARREDELEPVEPLP